MAEQGPECTAGWVRLSESSRWSDMRRFYVDAGATAWSTGQVPFYVTNNPYFASACGDVIAAWLRDVMPGVAHHGAGEPDRATAHRGWAPVTSSNWEPGAVGLRTCC